MDDGSITLPASVRIDRHATTGRDCVEHHHDRGRDQDAKRTGGRDHAGAEVPGVALLDHRRQDDGADGDDGPEAPS
jgi:hypothetical protein